jgi:hypothetical protein
MDLQSIISELKKERDRINRAIAALGGTNAKKTVAPSKTSSATGGYGLRKRHLTAAGRKRLSEFMKRRWAERRRKTSNRRNSAAKGT